MPCYHPLKGFRAKTPNPSGKRSIVFNQRDGFVDMPVTLPCGRCIGCRLNYSREWAIRCHHESKAHEENSFITVTYSDENIPKNGSLVLKDFQDFMKRLRARLACPYFLKKYPQYTDRRISYFHCGEYGEENGRPHYHACIFNFDFPDKKHWSTVRGEKYFRSQILEELWPAGHSMIGAVTFESAAYVARYICKKMTGPGSEIYYQDVDSDTGEILEKKKEYATMSKAQGIGKGWYEKYHKDAFPSDFIIIKGKKIKPPKYYTRLLEKASLREALIIKVKRKVGADAQAANNTHDRLAVREEIQYQKIEHLKRGLEKGPR